MNNHKSLDEFEFRLDSINDCGVSCPGVSEKFMLNLVSTFSTFMFDQIFFILAGKEDIYKIFYEFEIRLDSTTDCS